MKRIPLLTFFFVLYLCQPAMANSPPALQSILTLYSILPIMIIFTVLGGGYKILRGYYNELGRLGKKRFLPRSPIVKMVGAFLLILFAMPIDGPIIFIGLIFGLIALGRGVKLIKWGLLSLPGRKRIWYLVDANYIRLIPTGLILIMISLFLMGVPLAYFGYPAYYLDNADTDTIVRDLVAYQVAFSQFQKTKPKKILIVEQKNYRWYRKLNRLRRTYNIKLDSSESEKGFNIQVIPTFFPFFPYNYFMSRPSYVADHLGNIRMTYVHKAKSCPPEAPIVMKVEEKYIQNILKDIAH